MNAFVGLDFAENPVAVSAVHQESLDFGDFHISRPDLGRFKLLSS
jgi:hypothetical protein